MMHQKMRRHYLVFVLTAVALLAACALEPQPAEVTRIVTQEVPLTAEVTRLVTQVVVTEVPVEVTRIVAATATSTPEQPADESLSSAVSEQTAVLPTATSEPVSNVYTVESGDNLSLIATKTGVPVSEILTANNLTRESLLAVGQQLTVPGWDGEVAADVAALPPAAAATPEPEATRQPSVPVGPNLLPNPSFEGDWYFFNGVSEWQISEGWSLFIDEGPNNYESGTGDVFVRPEVRVVSKANLPAAEHALFVFEGEKTVKVFKGGTPVHFAVFTDVAVQPGTYRFSASFFADVVSVYEGGRKVWATHPLAAQVRFIENGGGSGWISVTPGQKSTLTYDFTVEEAGTVRIGAEFLNRLINNNNGWFLDDWSLRMLSTP